MTLKRAKHLVTSIVGANVAPEPPGSLTRCRTLVPRLIYVVAVFLLSFLAMSSQQMHVSGYFAPSAPPMSPHRREIGEHCIVELKQRYEVAGDLAGTMDVDLRIYVAGRHQGRLMNTG